LAVGIILALGLGRGLEGWSWNLGDTALLDWRWPRVMAAAAAGCMLALAGCMIQRLTGNPMSSPEVLGISAGAALGLIALLFLLPYSGPLAQLALGGLGAGLTLLLLLGLSRRSGFAPEKVLLIGISITALFDALQVSCWPAATRAGRTCSAGCPAPPISSGRRWRCGCWSAAWSCWPLPCPSVAGWSCCRWAKARRARWVCRWGADVWCCFCWRRC